MDLLLSEVRVLSLRHLELIAEQLEPSQLLLLVLLNHLVVGLLVILHHQVLLASIHGSPYAHPVVKLIRLELMRLLAYVSHGSITGLSLVCEARTLKRSPKLVKVGLSSLLEARLVRPGNRLASWTVVSKLMALSSDCKVLVLLVLRMGSV